MAKSGLGQGPSPVAGQLSERSEVDAQASWAAVLILLALQKRI